MFLLTCFNGPHGRVVELLKPRWLRGHMEVEEADHDILKYKPHSHCCMLTTEMAALFFLDHSSGPLNERL